MSRHWDIEEHYNIDTNNIDDIRALLKDEEKRESAAYYINHMIDPYFANPDGIENFDDFIAEKTIRNLIPFFKIAEQYYKDKA